MEVKANETAVVQFFNEKIVPPDAIKPAPQTGDDNAIIVWLVLLGTSVIGSITAVVLYVKTRKKGKKRFVVSVAMLLCLALLAGSGYMAAQEARQYTVGAEAYEVLTGYVRIPKPGNTVNTQESGTADAAPLLPIVDFDALHEINTDIRAWLLCDGTAINYPVAQSGDNEYYLNHLYDTTKNKVGCLFVDYENAGYFSDRNTIIYGHNMLDGSMFSGLHQYQEQTFYEANPNMQLMTPDGGYTMEIFAAFTVKPEESGTDGSPWQLSFESDEEYLEWQGEMRNRSMIQSRINLGQDDRVLTLSTCVNGGRDRFIVVGKLIPTE